MPDQSIDSPPKDDLAARSARALARYLGLQPSNPRFDVCDCGHYRGEHERAGRGRCREDDSYGVRCACPSYEAWTDPDDEEAVRDA
ncbi:hypothetical protein [Nocardia farcinica]|uniref:hypothetical protein n=1 Tax=Nocardia farcinica TaxID=37329 RepID=UPI00378F9E52